MTLTSTPTHWVLVHGAWHHPDHWNRLRDELGASLTSTVDLPSSGRDTAKLQDMYADARAIREHVLQLRSLEPDRRIVVVAHSYAGIPAAEGLASGSEALADELVFVGAFLLDVGQSLLSAVGGTLPDWWRVDEAHDVVDAADPIRHFYGDLDHEAATTAVTLLRRQRWSSFTQPLTQAAWHHLPTSYVVLDLDLAIPPAAQLAMASRAAPTDRALTVR